jgi:hypothetical protein
MARARAHTHTLGEGVHVASKRQQPSSFTVVLFLCCGSQDPIPNEPHWMDRSIDLYSELTERSCLECPLFQRVNKLKKGEERVKDFSKPLETGMFCYNLAYI